MIRFAPAAGLLLASPVVADAMLGRRGIDDALMALLIGVAAAALALWLLQLVSRTAPDVVPAAAAPEESAAAPSATPTTSTPNPAP